MCLRSVNITPGSKMHLNQCFIIIVALKVINIVVVFFFVCLQNMTQPYWPEKDRLFNHSPAQKSSLKTHLLQTPKMHRCCLRLHCLAVLGRRAFSSEVPTNKDWYSSPVPEDLKKTFQRHQWFKSDWIKNSPKAVIENVLVIIPIGHLETHYNQIN